MKLQLDGTFARFGSVILNRSEIAEVDVENGFLITNLGHEYFVDKYALEHWFWDVFDQKRCGNKTACGSDSPEGGEDEAGR